MLENFIFVMQNSSMISRSRDTVRNAPLKFVFSHLSLQEFKGSMGLF